MSYLLDHKNPHGPFYYTTRRNPIRVIVVHTAESLPDFNPPDIGAEAVARYGATTTRKVSWHATVDSDSIIDMLPDSYTAFHVANYNSMSLGVEIATRAASWATAPAGWVDATITNLATVIREWCSTHQIPYTRLTRAQVDNGQKGIIGHRRLDPTRRTDPGATFPWALLQQKLGNAQTPEDEMTTEQIVSHLTVDQLRRMKALGLFDEGIEGYWERKLTNPQDPEWEGFLVAIDINSKIAAATPTQGASGGVVTLAGSLTGTLST